jgi:serine protease AprX
MRRHGLLLTLLLAGLSAVSAEAQRLKYLILFRDKAASPYAVSRPQEFLSKRSIDRRVRQNIPVTERDLPPNPAYVAAVREAGATVWYPTRWANGVVADVTPEQLTAIRALPFVRGVEGNAPLNASSNSSSSTSRGRSGTKALAPAVPLPARAEPLDYGYGRTQASMIGADSMHARGYRGEGMWVAVLDNGFVNANQISCLQPLFADNRILGTYDFVNRETNVYNSGSHGTQVLTCLAAYQPGALIGTAPGASYLLLHTEEDAGERKIEEANWLVAVEYADSVGVDVINSSLGYTTFQDPATNYTYTDLNGRRGLATRAATWAAQAGMLVVVAAGNEGNDSWKYISVPADADSIIAVGAVTAARQYATFSSRGPTADGRVKPDLAAMGQNAVVGTPGGGFAAGNGTSFASPILAGMVTGFWQAHPELTNMQVIDVLRRSASQYSTPDDRLGYGIPNFVLASTIVASLDATGVRVFPNPSPENQSPRVQLPGAAAGKSFRVSLTDLRGTVLWQGTFQGNLGEVPVGTVPLTPGLYLLRFEGEGQAYTARWMRW